MNETPHVHRTETPERVGFALIICSSSRYETLQLMKQVDDPSGDLIVECLEKSGHRVVFRSVVPDDQTLVGQSVENALERKDVNAVITCGGTGVSPSDVTIEAVGPLLGKVLPGFGELFRRLSYDEIGSAALLSRALAGVTDVGKAVFCIPGSPQAAKLCLERFILPEVGHLLKHAQSH